MKSNNQKKRKSDKKRSSNFDTFDFNPEIKRREKSNKSKENQNQNQNQKEIGLENKIKLDEKTEFVNQFSNISFNKNKNKLFMNKNMQEKEQEFENENENEHQKILSKFKSFGNHFNQHFPELTEKEWEPNTERVFINNLYNSSNQLIQNPQIQDENLPEKKIQSKNQKEKKTLAIIPYVSITRTVYESIKKNHNSNEENSNEENSEKNSEEMWVEQDKF
ncbi:hypothetical protein M0811_03831 [Anaeramoeba ignava]|uniref:Uncharacterized protein n=1 Tax=Anaeramoeba ignava TaxID=1746090 RepID=A0A9Q0LUR2_ANAIG|nr:hypothetical protein M0811_03831 [Anaeramoeba ignava]